jgi:hypothetical protein
MGRIFSLETVVLPPLTAKIVDIDLELKNHVKDGIYFISFGDQQKVHIPNCIVDVQNGSTTTLVNNFSNFEQVLTIGSDLGHYEDITDCKLYKTDLQSQEISNNIATRYESLEIESADDLYDPDEYLMPLKFDLGEVKVGSQLNDTEKHSLIELLIKYKEVMAFDGHIGTTNLIEYEIDIQGNKPVHTPPYRCSPSQRDDIQTQAQIML